MFRRIDLSTVLMAAAYMVPRACQTNDYIARAEVLLYQLYAAISMVIRGGCSTVRKVAAYLISRSRLRRANSLKVPSIHTSLQKQHSRWSVAHSFVRRQWQ
jgi:hypothetical protein